MDNFKKCFTLGYSVYGSYTKIVRRKMSTIDILILRLEVSVGQKKKKNDEEEQKNGLC